MLLPYMQDEWQLLFHFVLQYPALVREAAEIKKAGIGIHVETALKKVGMKLLALVCYSYHAINFTRV